MKKSPKHKRKESFLRDNYRKCWRYIKESKNSIYIVVALFFAFAIFGFIFQPPSSVYNQLMNYLKNIVGGISGLSPARLIAFIFFNNAKVSLMGMALGVFLGIFPIFFSSFNGYILGFVAALSVKKDGVLVLWRLLPHGIFELPAVFISLGIGLKLGMVLVKDSKKFKEDFYNALRVFISIVVPLLIIAATIEGSLISFFGN